MNRIETAREIFRQLEEGNSSNVAEIARRAYCIQEIVTRN